MIQLDVDGNFLGLRLKVEVNPRFFSEDRVIKGLKRCIRITSTSTFPILTGGFKI